MAFYKSFDPLQQKQNLCRGSSDIISSDERGQVKVTKFKISDSQMTDLTNVIRTAAGIDTAIANKMDLVNNSQDVYNNIVIDYSAVATSLGLKDITYIPISAINGDNIVEKSASFPWYDGESLLHILENVAVANDINYTDARFPVQYVIRPQTDDLHDYRGYAGKVISGIYKKGDTICVQPSGLQSVISAIEIGGHQVEEAFAPQSVVLHLQHDIDISRGDVIVKIDNLPTVENELDVLLCWMGNKPLKAGNKYLLQINSRVVKSVVKEIE